MDKNTSQIQILHGSHVPDCHANVDKFFEGYYSIQLISSGDLFLSYDRRELHLKPPYFFTCYPGPRTRFWQINNKQNPSWHHQHLAFRGPKVQEWISSGLFFFGEQNLSDLSDYREQMLEMFKIFQEGSAWSQERVSARLECLLADLAHLRQDHNRPTWLQICLNSLTPTEAPDYQIISRKCHMSLSYLRKKFREAMGESLHDYWLELRLRKACQMIENPHKSFGQISDELGYSDVSFFSRQFKKFYGMNPKDYRNGLLE
jgi:AraC-like DNA-binding protein